MATLLRLASRKARFLVPRCQHNLTQTCNVNLRNPITMDEVADVSEQLHYPPKNVAKLGEKDENWISYGYSLTDKDEDYYAHHMIMFWGITVLFVVGGFIVAYLPDHRLSHWSMREAHLQIARREKLGLPIIDHNLIHVSKIDLPTDEELGDTPVIV